MIRPFSILSVCTRSLLPFYASTSSFSSATPSLRELQNVDLHQRIYRNDPPRVRAESAICSVTMHQDGGCDGNSMLAGHTEWKGHAAAACASCMCRGYSGTLAALRSRHACRALGAYPTHPLNPLTHPINQVLCPFPSFLQPPLAPPPAALTGCLLEAYCSHVANTRLSTSLQHSFDAIARCFIGSVR